MLDGAGFSGKYNFLYVAMHFQRRVGLEYCIVNLVENAVALQLRNKFEGFNSWTTESLNVCETKWSHPRQGLQAHIKRYRDSPLMHRDVHEDYKLMLFDENGVEKEWPPPIKKIRKPRMKSDGAGFCREPAPSFFRESHWNRICSPLADARQEGEEGAAENGNQEAGPLAEGQ